MKVYVDFDRTLFDCERFLGDLYELINHYGIDKLLFKECQNQCIKKGFNPYVILDSVKKKHQFDDKLYEEIKDLIKKTNAYLFSDAITFLKYLKDNNYKTILLTKGNISYQNDKVHYANIEKYYDKLIITMKHKGDLKIDYQNGIFVDDNPQEIKSILKRKVMKVIYLKREDAKYSKMPIDENITSVKSLQEIIDKQLL